MQNMFVLFGHDRVLLSILKWRKDEQKWLLSSEFGMLDLKQIRDVFVFGALLGTSLDI